MSNLFNNIINLVKENQFLLAGIGLSGAGLLTFWLRDVPRSFIRFIKRELTTELILTSQNECFYQLLKWMKNTFPKKNFRHLKLSNGRFGGDDASTLSIGYGFHYFRFKGKRYLITLNKESANQTERDKEFITIKCFGRSRKHFETLVDEIVKTDNSNHDKIKIYQFKDRYWSFCRHIFKRGINSVFLEKDKKDLLLDSLNSFIEREQWYIENGIPYQYGILLHGAPGTGKTSLIKAIATHLQYPIFYLSPKNLSKIQYAMESLDEKCIIVIEDIDSNSITHSRVDDDDDEKECELDEMMSNSISTNISEVLNSIDGLFSAHGRILIATTNHIEKLDSALIRPGRIDLKIEIGYVDNEILQQFLKSFFPESKTDLSKIHLRPNVTVAELQNYVLQGKTEKEILDEIKIGVFSREMAMR